VNRCISWGRVFPPVEDREFKVISTAIAMRTALSGLSSGWRKRGHQLGLIDERRPVGSCPAAGRLRWRPARAAPRPAGAM
jgi:hypothetical protein